MANKRDEVLCVLKKYAQRKMISSWKKKILIESLIEYLKCTWITIINFCVYLKQKYPYAIVEGSHHASKGSGIKCWVGIDCSFARVYTLLWCWISNYKVYSSLVKFRAKIIREWIIHTINTHELSLAREDILCGGLNFMGSLVFNFSKTCAVVILAR